MDLRILLAVALIACAQAFEIRDARWRKEDNSQYLPDTLEKQYVDPYPSLNVPDVLTKDVKLGNIIDETEPEIEGRVRRSPKEPARGEIVVEGNARKGHSTGGKTEGQIYVGGRIRFRRSADEQTQNIVEETEPEIQDRVRRSPKEPATGKIVVSGNARKGSSTGGKTEGQVYVGGQIRFRRSELDTPKHIEEIIDQVDEEKEETRVRRSPKKKGSGRVILRGEAGQSTGRRADVGVHVIGEYRFRRSAEQELAQH